MNTLKDLNVLLEKWQKRLRLCDWKITIERQRGYNFPNKTPQWGIVENNPCLKVARIKLLDPMDYSFMERLENVEEEETTIVHELIHLHFVAISLLDPDRLRSGDYNHYEGGVESLAIAFRNLEKEILK